MFCGKCGTENLDVAAFCKSCGASLAEEQSSVMTSETPVQGPQEEYKPIGMWGYLGYEILFSLPVVGIVFLLIFSLGGTKNINLRNFARSYFCITIINIIVLTVIVLKVFGPFLKYMI